MLLSFCSIQAATVKTFKQSLKHPDSSKQKLIAAIRRYAAASSFDPSTGDIKIDPEAQKAAFNSIKQILKNGISANTKENGLSVLELAILTGSLELVELLLHYKANPNYITRDGTTPLVMALNSLGTIDKKVSLKIINALIKAGAKVNMAIIDPLTKDHLMPLEIAIINHDIKAQVLLGGYYAVRDRYALIDAAKKNDDSERAQALVHTGLDLNLQDKEGNTALMWATQRGDTALAQALIAAGADLDLQDDYGNTAFTLAAKHKNFAIVQALIAAGVDINHQDNYGNTAFMWAAEKYPILARFLINAGVDLNLKNGNGNTALMLVAIKNDRVSTAQDLIHAGAKLNVQNKDGDTALMCAIKNNHPAIALDLINSRVDPDLQGVKVDLNLPDVYGNTALMWVVINHDLDLAEALIAAGADLSLKNKKGKTVFDYAANQPKIRAILDAAVEAQHA